MGYLIRMAPEIEEWLAAVRDRDPAATLEPSSGPHLLTA